MNVGSAGARVAQGNHVLEIGRSVLVTASAACLEEKTS